MNIACYYGQGYITLTVSESVFGGTVCGKAARTGLWGSGEVTDRSTRRAEKSWFCSNSLVMGSLVFRTRRPVRRTIHCPLSLKPAENVSVSLRKHNYVGHPCK